MIKKTPAIKNHALEFLRQGTFRDCLADQFCRSLVCTQFFSFE
jgi:hypothetical protein